MTSKRVLYEILKDLNSEELKDFNLKVELEKGVPLLPKHHPKGTNAEEVVELMVEKFSEECVELTKNVLKKMNRTDLVQRLSDSSAGSKEKHSVQTEAKQWPSLIQRVEMIMSDIEVLMDTLSGLNEEEIKDLRNKLKHTSIKINESDVSWWQLTRTNANSVFVGDHQETVFTIIMIYGRHSVKTTREILKKMKRTYLVQRLSDTSSRLKKKESDGQRSALIQKVATMAAVKQLLLETLLCLSKREFTEFKELLERTVSQKKLRTISHMWTEREGRAEIVNLMMRTYGQQSVELSREVLEEMNRTDLIQMLSESSSALKEKHSGDKQPTSTVEAVKENDEQILSQTLRDLSFKELKKFRFLLQFTYFQRSLPQINWIKTEPAHQLETLVDLMVENQQPLEVTKEVLMNMNRSDLVERLSGTSSGLKGTSLKDHKQLLEILEKLSPGDLEKFKHVLQYSKLRGFPKIPGDSMVTADKAETARLMVKNYGQQSVEVTKDVLERIKRMDLVEKLSESSSGSQGPSGSLEPEVCGRSSLDSSLWTKLEPGVNSSGGDESPTYSLQSETGNYECRVSGLRWVCKEEVSFQYHFCSWGGHMKRMESIKFMPAGPLIDIKVITGRLNEVYLPHWIYTEDDSKISDSFAVLHMDDCGDVVENVSEVTPSHVKLSEPVFSPRGVLMKIGLPLKIRCSLLIYYKPNTPFLKMRVYLIPCDPALQQIVDQAESSEGFQKIKNPRPDKPLKLKKGFSLTADIKTAEINPQKITLGYDNQDKIFYQVFIEKPNRKFQLALSYTSKKEVQSDPVWTFDIRKDDYQNPASEDKPVDDRLSAQMTVVTIGPTDRERLLKTLEDLTQEELKKFKWYLQDMGILAGLPSISRSELENKDRPELVELMLGTYGTQCMDLTRRVLRAMNKNNLAETLSDIRRSR